MRSSAASRIVLITRNAFSVLASDVVNRATTFVLYALVARNLGAYAFGQMSLALTFFYLTQVLAVAGLKTLLTREVAKRPDLVRDYLRGGSLIVVAGSFICMAGLYLLVLALGYAPDTATVILLLSLGLFPYALSQVFEAVFQALERMNYIAYANVPVNALKVIAALALLSADQGLVALVVLLVAAHGTVAIVEWCLLVTRIDLPPSQADRGFALRLARLTRPFLGIDGLVAVMSSANIVLLSKLATEREVGLYNAAAQLMVPIGLVIGSATLSVFPDLCAKYVEDRVGLRRTAQNLAWVMFALVLPAAVGLFFLADDVLVLLYGEATFLAASGVLRIMVWGVVLVALTSVFGDVLMASTREGTNLRITAVDAVATVVLGAVLIVNFGLIGAAAAALLVRLIDFVLHYAAASQLLPDFSLPRLLWKPALASVCMAGALALLPGEAVVVVVAVGALVYATALAGLELVTTGGVQGVRARYRSIWSD